MHCADIGTRRPGKLRGSWTAVGLAECYRFLWCECLANSLQGAAEPRALICHFLRRPSRGLCALEHGDSLGGHPLVALVRIWHAVGGALRDGFEGKLPEDPVGNVARTLADVFRGLDLSREDETLSLLPLVDALAAAQPMIAALCGRHTDFTVFTHHMLRLLLPTLDPAGSGQARGIWMPSSPAGEALVGIHTRMTVRRSFSCCQRTLPMSQTGVEFQAKDLPLDVLLMEACLHQEEVVEGEYLLCDVCGATDSQAAGRLCFRRFLPDTPVLRFGFDRVAPHTWEHVADPIGVFPEVLRLPADLFGHAHVREFGLVALLLNNHSPLRAALGFSVVIRGADGSWWWHRRAASEWDMDLLGRPAAEEQSWDKLQELRDIIVALYYVRL